MTGLFSPLFLAILQDYRIFWRFFRGFGLFSPSYDPTEFLQDFSAVFERLWILITVYSRSFRIFPTCSETWDCFHHLLAILPSSSRIFLWLLP